MTNAATVEAGVPAEAGQRQDTPQAPKRNVDLALDAGRQSTDPAEKLHGLVDDLYRQIDSKAIAPGSLAAPEWFPNAAKPTGYALVLQKLDEARTAIKAGELPKAERLYHEARGLYNWCERELHWAEERVSAAVPWFTHWMAIILYEVGWLAAAVAVAEGAFGGDPAGMKLLGVPVTYLAWGTVGGATWAIFGVWLHTIRSDFDRAYLAWYATKPLLGGIAGALVFLLADMISAQISTDTADKDVLYFAAFVLGFFEALLVNVLETLRQKVTSAVRTLLGQTASASAS
jgi:hypothetical protein